MKNLTPIETSYKGYRFRSRLEARWAVFFDAVSVKWEYEPEGYNMSGMLYLPDFWLPTFNTIVEIKPRYDLKIRDIPRDQVEKVVSLAKARDDIKVSVFMGSPTGTDDYKLFYVDVSMQEFLRKDWMELSPEQKVRWGYAPDAEFDELDGVIGDGNTASHFWECPKCKRVTFFHKCLGCNKQWHEVTWDVFQSEKMISAYNAVRSTRLDKTDKPKRNGLFGGLFGR